MNYIARVTVTRVIHALAKVTSLTWYHFMYPLPVGWILPQLAPTPGLRFIRSISLMMASVIEGMERNFKLSLLRHFWSKFDKYHFSKNFCASRRALQVSCPEISVIYYNF